jgi:NDP-sugar pyrophosphorylase family protein
VSGELPPVCVLAGGLGTRLGELARDRPKALMPVAGEPFIRHPLRDLAAHGARRIVLCVGHHGEMIRAELGDGTDLGLEISYAFDPPGLAGTAGAIRNALGLLGESFLTLYGDTYLTIDYAGFARAFLASGLDAQMAVLRNEGRWDASNALVEGGLVTRHDKRDPTPEMEWIDYGLGAFRREVFERGAGAAATDLSDVYAELADQRRLGAYPASERFHEIGTPEALAETDSFLRERAR